MQLNDNYVLVRNLLSLIFAVAFLTACGDSSQQGSSKLVQTCETSEGISLEPRYLASLSEGISFSKAGYPNFVSCVQGISVADSTLGRWTDGFKSEIMFSDPLPEKFVLRISAGAAPHWQNIPIKIVVGAREFETKFGKSDSWTESKEVAIPVDSDGKARSIIFKFPDAKSPHDLGLSKDDRKLALFLINIKIEKY